MQSVFSTSLFTVFDGVLREEEQLALWRWFQEVPMKPLDSIDHAWRLEDGKPLLGPHFETHPPHLDSPSGLHYPTGYPIDAVLREIISVLPQLLPWIGEQGRDWTNIAATPSVYPAGTALSWHQDTSKYSGAFIFYAHLDWNVQWGGELLIASRDAVEPPSEPQFRFDNEAFSEWLLARGIGHFVLPKPNRMVVLSPESRHMVTPVRRAAGRHVRASVAGFFDRGPRLA